MRNIIASRGSDQFPVRFPNGLRDRIKDFADANGRSMNSEIIATLIAAYPAPIEPESPNEALRKAAESVMDGWSDALRAMGANPEQNEALNRLRAKVDEATK